MQHQRQQMLTGLIAGDRENLDGPWDRQKDAGLFCERW